MVNGLVPFGPSISTSLFCTQWNSDVLLLTWLLGMALEAMDCVNCFI